MVASLDSPIDVLVESVVGLVVAESLLVLGPALVIDVDVLVAVLLPLLPIVSCGSSSAGQPASVRPMSTAPAVRPST